MDVTKEAKARSAKPRVEYIAEDGISPKTGGSSMGSKSHPLVKMQSGDMDLVFDEVMLEFLTKAAEHGMSLDEVTIGIYEDVFTDGEEGVIFDGTLDSFMLIMLERMKLRKPVGSALLEFLMGAVSQHHDIDLLIEDLQESLAKRKSVNKSHGEKRHNAFLCIPQMSKSRHIRLIECKKEFTAQQETRQHR